MIKLVAILSVLVVLVLGMILLFSTSLPLWFLWVYSAIVSCVLALALYAEDISG